MMLAGSAPPFVPVEKGGDGPFQTGGRGERQFFDGGEAGVDLI